MGSIRAKFLNLPDEVSLVPKIGKGREEYISAKEKNFYGLLCGKLSRLGLGKGNGSNSRFGRGISRSWGGKYSQRVVVKARFKKHTKRAAKGLKRHVFYLSREGVNREGGAAKLFNGQKEFSRGEGVNKVNEWVNDRHHWRIIISPERGRDLNLEHFTNQFMAAMERDLGTKLEWLSSAHYDTENYHIHLLIRGKTDKGEDLIIKRQYVSYGMRDLAEELATKMLGKRKEWEIRLELEKSVYQSRFGAIDRKLLFEAKKTGIINLESSFNLKDREILSLKIKRLKFLRTLGLSKRIAPGKWKLSSTMEQTLRALGIEGDIIKTMHAKMRSDRENIVFKPGGKSIIMGKVVHKGFIDPLSDKTFLLVEGNDGKNYYISLSKYSEREGEESRIGDLVKVFSVGLALKPIDRVIIAVAKEGRGVIQREDTLTYLYQHSEVRNGASPEGYLKNLERRLLALEKKKIVNQIEDRVWSIPVDLEDRIKSKHSQYVKVIVERKRDKSSHSKSKESKVNGRKL